MASRERFEESFVAPSIDTQDTTPETELPAGVPNVPGAEQLAAPAPPPVPTRRFSDDPRITQVNEERRQRVEAAAALHIGNKIPGVDALGFHRPLANRFIQMFGDNPAMVDAVERDVSSFLALTDTEIAERVMRGQPLTELSDVWDAMTEVSWQVGATELAAILERERADAVKGTFESVTLDEALLLSDVREGAGRTERRREEERVQTFRTLFDVPGAWSYSPSSNVLAVTVGEQTIGVETRPGFDPDSHLDVMAEVVAAQADGRIAGGELTGGQDSVVAGMMRTAHKVGAWLEENPKAEIALDKLWAFFNPRAGDSDEDPLFNAGPIEQANQRLRNDDGQITEQSIRQASVIPFPEDATIAAVAREFMQLGEEVGVVVQSADALDLAADVVDENRDQFLEDFRSMTQTEIIEQLEGEAEGRTAFGEAFESSMQNTMNALVWWDDFSQMIGVNVMDFFGDLIVGAQELEEGNWEEGWTRLNEMFEVEEFGVTASDHFDIDEDWAGAVDFAAAVAFDPFNFVFPGAKGLRKMAHAGLTNPKLAPLYVRMGTYPQFVKSIARKPGEIAGEEGVRNIILHSGLDNQYARELVDLAWTPSATEDDVREVLIRAIRNGDYLGEGTFRATRHSTVLGIGHWLDNVAAGRMSAENRDTLVRFLARLSVGRTRQIGEAQSLDEIGQLLVELFPTDKDAMTGWYLAAIDRLQAAGDDVALDGVAQMTKEAARRELWEVGGTIRAIEGPTNLRNAADNLQQIRNTLATIDQAIPDEAARSAARESLERMARIMRRRLDDAKPKAAAAAARKRLAQKKLNNATRLEADSVHNRARNEIAALMHEIYDDVAERINAKAGEDVIPKIEGTNFLAPHVDPRDWSAVTGVKREIASNDDTLRLLMGIAVDDVTQAKNASAVGLLKTAQQVILPASPYEIMLFEKLGPNEGIQRFFRNEALKKINRGMKFAFAFNLLTNPLTAGKITLDETLRFFADTGEFAKFLEATGVGLPFVGGPIEKAGRRLFGRDTVNPFMLQKRRNVGFFPNDHQSYVWLTRPEGAVGRRSPQMDQFVEQAERWINGTLLNDRVFRNYARWVDEAVPSAGGGTEVPAGFRRWWDEGGDLTQPGRNGVRHTHATLEDTGKGAVMAWGDELTAQQAWDIIDNIFNRWLELTVDAGKPQTNMRKALLRAATRTGDEGRLDIVRDAQLFKSLKQIPGMEMDGGFVQSVFNIFFGAPSGRRAGVFYDHYFDEAMDILTNRHADRLLTKERLMHFAGMDEATADFHLKMGAESRVVSDLMRKYGVRTEAQLRAKAGVYAERRADDLMYRFTAVSAAGRGAEAGLMFPYARAQMDFLSWWWDHMTKPMTLRIPMEVRAQLPGRVRQAVETVERIPINLRAMGRFSHMAAAINDDQPSMMDEIMKELTFFPLEFGAEFMLSLTPQLGPLPSWLYDAAIDADLVGDDVADVMTTLFPATEFTDFATTDMFDRYLPNSRRSLRDLVAAGLRGAYNFFGEDIHTDTSKWGQAANFINDGKRPAATQDFQKGLGVDFLNDHAWDIQPGSADYQERSMELALKGALEANKNELSQDVRDRVVPWSGYDKEFRTLKSFDVIFEDDSVFRSMEAFGIFDQNDLLEVDGQPRIKKLWDEYKNGEASEQDLEFLADALVSSYFKAGEVEILPGFSYLDWLNIKSPGIAINLINKSEDSGIPTQEGAAKPVGNLELTHAEFRQEYVNSLTGRLQNVPEGPAGADFIRDAKRLGWIINRPMESTPQNPGWLEDAHKAAYGSARDAIRGAWEWVSYRTWREGLTQKIEDKTFILDSRTAKVLNQTGLDVEAGQEFTYGDFHEMLDDFDERFKAAQPLVIDTIQQGTVHAQLSARGADDPYAGAGLMEAIHQADLEFRRDGILSIDEWPAEIKAEIRERFGEAITQGYTTEEDYRQEMEPLFGPLDWEPPQPPQVADLEAGIRLTGDELEDMRVIDGDGLSLLLDDGALRVRLVGINAPEVTQEGYQEARSNLERLVADAQEIVLGIYKPEVYGMAQRSAPGEQRIKAWLYVDGIPIFDESVFTVENQIGASVGGTVLDLEEVFARNSERYSP